MNKQIIITETEGGFLWSIYSCDGMIDGFEKDRFQAFKAACAAYDKED